MQNKSSRIKLNFKFLLWFFLFHEFSFNSINTIYIAGSKITDLNNRCPQFGQLKIPKIKFKAFISTVFSEYYSLRFSLMLNLCYKMRVAHNQFFSFL